LFVRFRHDFFGGQPNALVLRLFCGGLFTQKQTATSSNEFCYSCHDLIQWLVR
jgi:nitrate/TMAO reductase-like tetraheme cytochrome c subunit